MSIQSIIDLYLSLSLPMAYSLLDSLLDSLPFSFKRRDDTFRPPCRPELSFLPIENNVFDDVCLIVSSPSRAFRQLIHFLPYKFCILFMYLANFMKLTQSITIDTKGA